jgi:dihydrofolate synthase/folylpolyglutamate synthase
MSYNEAVHYLYSLQKHGIKFGLDNITRLLSGLGNPQKSFLSVHVAGTNGKGSTSAIIASILQTSGLRVGLFTSPHLISFTERIKIDGEEIAENEIVRLAGEIRKTVSLLDDLTPTFFEVVTAMAFLHFKREAIDIAVVEVGMGGRLDSTNIIMPEVSVITDISYDHKEFLGNTLGQIASEKAGIIKKGVPVVISRQEPDIAEVIRNKAVEKHAELYIYGEDFSSVLKKGDISGITFDYENGNAFQIRDLFLPLTGEHQMENASVALKAATIVLKSPDIRHRLTLQSPFTKGGARKSVFSSSDIHRFIKEGINNVRWPGRLEFIHENPAVVIDGAHNPAAAAALSRTLRGLFLETYKRIVLVLGIMGDKDIAGIMQPLLPLASEIVLTAPSYDRAASPEKLADIAAFLGFSDVHIAPTMKDAIEAAEKIAGLRDRRLRSQDVGNAGNESRCPDSNSTLIVITGSFYTIGEAKEVFGQKGILTRMRE